MLGANVDVAVSPKKPHRNPFLPLTAIAPMQRDAEEVLRQIIREPFLHLAERLGLARADFLFELAKGRFHRLFAFVDAALWHLPAFDGLVDAAPDEYETIAIDQHHAYARPVGEVFVPQESLWSRHGAIVFQVSPRLQTRAREQSRAPSIPPPTKRPSAR